MEARNALSRLVRFEPGEGAGLAWSALSFFFILGGYYVIRPLRDEMGASSGGGFALNWLFFGACSCRQSCTRSPRASSCSTCS